VVLRKTSQQGIRITARQAEILEGVGQGLTFATIARRLSLSPATVAYHVGQMQMKLHTGSLPALVALAMVGGILTNDQFPLQLTGNLILDGVVIPE
jgi:DNA-binding CsgD family transcriptional regulator